MFKSKTKKNQFQAKASFGFNEREEDNLVINLKRNTKNSSWLKNQNNPSQKNWYILVALPKKIGQFKFLLSKPKKDINFISNFEKTKSLKSKRTRLPKTSIFSLIKLLLNFFKKVFFILPFLILKILKLGRPLFKILPFKNIPLYLRKTNQKKVKPLKKLRIKNISKEDKKISQKEEDQIFVVDKLYASNRFFLKSLLSFFLLLFLISFPFKVLYYYTSFDLISLKNKVLGSSEKAFNSFGAAARSLAEMNTEEASHSFSQANLNFTQAKEEVENIDNFLLELSRFAPQEELRLAAISKQVLSAGEAASNLGKHLTLAFDALLELKTETDSSQTPLQIINQFQSELVKALEEAKLVNQNITGIKPDIIPERFRLDFLSLQSKVGGIEHGLSDLILLTEKSKIFLGDRDYNKRYLVLFQNSNELRATGGFIGSFAEISLKSGEIQEIKVPEGGSYDVDWGMTNFIEAPAPLQLISEHWHFRNANWWPDWPTSAENLIRFYENSGGPTVDGCIAITPKALGRILEITGPLDMREDYGIIVDEDNFWISIRQEIEKEKESKEPKRIIHDLTYKIIEELGQDLNKEKLMALFSGIKESLDFKDVQFYFTNPELQTEVVNRGWAGEIKNTSVDYLLVVNTNIAGQKSDKNIEQIINHKTQVEPDGTIINELEITRIHHGYQDKEKYYQARNVNWMRIYVPKNSELIESEGFERPGDKFFKQSLSEIRKHSLIKKQEEQLKYHRSSGTEIYPEQNKTVFANWSILDPGETEIIKLKYKLPFKLTKEDVSENWWNNFKNLVSPAKQNYSSYSLLVQRQAGTYLNRFNSVLSLPPNFKPVWIYPEDKKIRANGWLISEDLNSDKYWATILKLE